MKKLIYDRVLLKLSGEALGLRGQGISQKKIKETIKLIKVAKRLGCQLAIVIGGGNWWRKRDGHKIMSPISSDYMGMLGTVLNSLILKDYLNNIGLKTVVQSWLVTMPGLDKVDTRRARLALTREQIVIFAAGTGRPHVTTDTAAAQRAHDIKAQIIFKVGNTDGVYTANPDTNKQVKKFKELTFTKAKKLKLKIIDQGAYNICQKAEIPIMVFRWNKKNLVGALQGQNVGTVIGL